MKQYYSISIIYVLLILIQFGCKSDPDITVYKIKKKLPSVTQTLNKKTPAIPINWTVPNNWVKKKPKDFGIASYDVSIDNGEIANVSISIFPGDAGGIEQNVNRWRRQLNLPPQNSKTILQNSKNEFNMIGNYFVFYLKNESAKKGILASIIPHLKENKIFQTIFIKLSGTDSAINELEYEFNIFCKSMHLTNQK